MVKVLNVIKLVFKNLYEFVLGFVCKNRNVEPKAASRASGRNNPPEVPSVVQKIFQFVNIILAVVLPICRFLIPLNPLNWLLMAMLGPVGTIIKSVSVPVRAASRFVMGKVLIPVSRAVRNKEIITKSSFLLNLADFIIETMNVTTQHFL